MIDIQRLLDEITAAGGWVVLLQLLLIAFVTFLVLRFARSIVHAALRSLLVREVTEGTSQDLSADEVERRRKTLEDLGYRALRVVIVVIAGLMALGVLRLDIGPAIAGLSIIGLAFSLGAQNLVRDYVAGAFVLIENQYSEGDVVTIADVSGVVEDVNLRRTTLRSIDGTLHFVPHGLIGVSSNLTRIWARVAFDVPVTYQADLPRLAEIINQAGREMAADPAWKDRVLEAPAFLRVADLGRHGTGAKVLGMVAANDRWDATGEMRRRILEGATAAGIQVGWPIYPDTEQRR